MKLLLGERKKGCGRSEQFRREGISRVAVHARSERRRSQTRAGLLREESVAGRMPISDLALSGIRPAVAMSILPLPMGQTADDGPQE